MGTQFVAAVYRRVSPCIAVYEAAALFRFYFSKNLVAYVTARMHVSRRVVGSASERPSSASAHAILIPERFSNDISMSRYFSPGTFINENRLKV